MTAPSSSAGSKPKKSALERLKSAAIPGTTGSLYTLWPGTIGFMAVLWVYVDSYYSCKHTPACTVPVTPGITGEMLTAVVAMLGVHTVRASLADKRNAENGLAPVPVSEEGAPVLTGTLERGSVPAGTEVPVFDQVFDPPRR